MIEKINIAIAEDHRLVRQGFVRMLSDYPQIHILFEASNGKELLKQLKDHKPSIILLDIEMPIVNGIDAMTTIKERYPKIKFIVISSFAEETSIIEYVKLGANSFLKKDCDVDQLIETITELNEKNFSFDSELTKLLLKFGAFPENIQTRLLTEREISVLTGISKNLSNAEIGKLLGVKERTIDWYKYMLFHKTNCNDIASLLDFAKSKNYI